MTAKFPNFLPLMIAFAAMYFALNAAPLYAQEKKIPPGSKILVRNDYGNITITGWERETIEAVAIDAARGETVSASISENLPVSNRILITAKPNKTNPQGKIRLEVKIPRYAELEPIDASSGNVSVSDLDGSVKVKTESGEITIRRTSAVYAQTKNGEIKAENIEGDFTAKTENGNVKLADVEGSVNVTTGNGNVEMRRIGDHVKIVAINSKIHVQCAQDDVEISDTSSQIMLLNIDGNVDVSTSNGKASFIGSINDASRYRLKTLSGAVSMTIPENSGFRAILSSYGRHIETDFKSQEDSQTLPEEKGRRLLVRNGDGEARIELDSFDGRVRLSRTASSAIEKCEKEKQ